MAIPVPIRQCGPGGGCDAVAAVHRRAGQVQALVGAVRAVAHVVRLRGGGQHHVAGADDVAAAHLVRIELQPPAELVQRPLDREDDLTEPVTAERAGRRGVGVDGGGVDLLVRAAVDGERLVAAVEHHADRVVAVGPGVAQHVDGDRGDVTLGGGAHLHRDAHRVPARGPGELLAAGELQLHGAAGLEHPQQHDVLGEQLLLGPEAATHPGGDHPEPATVQAEDPAQLVAHQERHLRAGAHHHPPVGGDPAQGAVGLEVGVLHPGCAVHLLDDDRGGGETGGRIADLGVHLGGDVAGPVDHPGGGRVLVRVDLRRVRLPGLLGIDDRGQDVVVDDDCAAARLGGGHRLGDHGGHPLPDEPDDGVEDPGVVDVVEPVLVPAGGEEHVRRVVGGEHGDDTGYLQRGADVHPADPGVRVRTPQQLRVQQAGHREIQRVGLGPGDDTDAGGRGDGLSDGRPAVLGLHVDDAADGILHGAVPRAAAEVALELAGQVVEVGGGERRRGDHHAGGAETALEPLSGDEIGGHRVQLTDAEAGDRGDGVPDGLVRREHAGVHRGAVDEDRAGAAVPRVAALLDPEVPLFTDVGPQALTRPRCDRRCGAVDLDDPVGGCRSAGGALGVGAHASSCRISTASTPVMCRRQGAAP